MIDRRVWCAAWVLGPAAWAAEPVPAIVREVRRRLADEPVLRGSFEQRKTVKAFRNPIVSRGEFAVVRERGVLWRTQEPFASTLAVSRDRIVARQADGTVTRRLQAQEEPALRAITQTLFALLSADLAGLAERFQIEGDMDAQGWRLLLTPRDPALARWLRRVELEGDRFLRSARLLEASEDATLIRLARHAAGPALSAAEEAQFD